MYKDYDKSAGFLSDSHTLLMQKKYPYKISAIHLSGMEKPSSSAIQQPTAER